MMRRFFWILVAPTTIIGCGSRPPETPPLAPVRVEGSELDIGELAGEWEGEFHNASTGRRGTISFSLRRANETAYGPVVMTTALPFPACTDPLSTAVHSPLEARIALSVATIGVGGRSVGGWLQPYRDPERGCWVDTWFEGRFRDDTLGGRYFSHPADGEAVLRGTWWVTRTR